MSVGGDGNAFSPGEQLEFVVGQLFLEEGKREGRKPPVELGAGISVRRAGLRVPHGAPEGTAAPQLPGLPRDFCSP